MEIDSIRNLGYREVYRLCQFILFMIDNYTSDCDKGYFGYDLKYDEPYIYIDSIVTRKFYARDYDVAYNAHNELERI